MSCNAKAAIAVQKTRCFSMWQGTISGRGEIDHDAALVSFPTKSASDADLSRASFKYHFDLDDWRMLKFFFYLSDVDEGCRSTCLCLR